MGRFDTGDGGTLSACLAEAVSRHPDRPAVRERHRQVSYAELDQVVNAVASLFSSSGQQLGARVGVWLNKSVEAVAAIHAVLRAGAAYVPVDPTTPPRRAAMVLADADPAWLVTTPERAASLDAVAPQLMRRRSLLLVGGTDANPDQEVAGWGQADSQEVTGWGRALITYADAPRVTTRAGADDLAYILYTSGSTGTPKGVALTNANARAFVDWAAKEFALTCLDVLSSHAPFHFDLSILDLFAAAASASCVSLVPESWQGLGPALVRFVADQRVSVWYSVPTALRRMAEASNSELLASSALRLVAFAGEEYPVRRLRRLAAALPEGTALYNLYGPTETNVCTYHQLTAEDLAAGGIATGGIAADGAKSVPIGKPCPYAATILLGGDGQLPAADATGELCVAGSSVMRGYWRDAEKTRLSTVQAGRVRYYRTGDIVSRDAHGRFVFLGRRDGMVKVNGHRIELGEVEAVLEGRPDIAEAACAVAPGADGAGRLVALVTAAAGASPQERGLRRYCRERLPGYMVPDRIKPVAMLPYTSTGKVDRRWIAAECTRETVRCARS